MNFCKTTQANCNVLRMLLPTHLSAVLSHVFALIIRLTLPFESTLLDQQPVPAVGSSQKATGASHSACAWMSFQHSKTAERSNFANSCVLASAQKASCNEPIITFTKACGFGVAQQTEAVLRVTSQGP